MGEEAQELQRASRVRGRAVRHADGHEHESPRDACLIARLAVDAAALEHVDDLDAVGMPVDRAGSGLDPTTRTLSRPASSPANGSAAVRPGSARNSSFRRTTRMA